MSKPLITTSSPLSSLLPYDTCATTKKEDLSKKLKDYQFVLHLFVRAISALQKGELEKFDAVVGDNACQVPALRISLIAKNRLIDIQRLQIQATVVQKKIDDLLSPKKVTSLRNTGFSFHHLLANEHLDIFLNPEAVFLTQAFILAETRVYQSSETLMPSLLRGAKPDPQRLKSGKIWEMISNSFVKNLVQASAISVSTASVQYIREQASALQDPNLIKMVSEPYTIHLKKANTPKNFECQPMFWSCQTVLKAAQKECLPLIIRAKFMDKQKEGFRLVEDAVLFFKSVQKGTFYEYVKAEPSATDLNDAAWVVEGSIAPDMAGKRPTKAEWLTKMNHLSPEDLILACAAEHRQYPDATQDVLAIRENDTSFKKYKGLAANGFSETNPTTFFTQHIFANKVGNMIQHPNILSIAPIAPIAAAVMK